MLTRFRTNAKFFGLVTIATAVVIAAAALTSQLQLGFGDTKLGVDPWAGLTHEEREGEVARAHARNREYLENFIRSGQDPRSLPRGNVHAFGISPATLEDAFAQAEIVATATVSATSFASNPTGVGMPVAAHIVDLEQVIKGSAGDTLTVNQLGGPVAQEGDAGALAQLSNDELLLPGDSVLLMLRQDDSQWRPLPGAGVVFFRDGLAFPEASSAFGAEISGLTKAALVLLVTTLSEH